MVVSRSITQTPSAVTSSSSTLLSLVSLWVTRSGMSPEAIRSVMREQSAARARAKSISAATSGGAAGAVRRDGGLQRLEPFRSVVEIRDRLVQALAAESGGEFLELAEGARRLIGLLVGFEFVIAAGAAR